MQMIFSTSAFVAARIDASHVLDVIQLSSADLLDIVPVDPPGFVWAESAEINAAAERWEPTTIRLDPHFRTTGFR